MAEKDEKKIRRYLPHTVYLNLQKFLEYRKLELVSGAIYTEMKKNIGKEVNNNANQEEFIKNIQYYGYVLMEAKDQADKDRRFHKSVLPVNRKREVKTYILLLDLDSIYAQSSQNFSKVLNRIPGFDESARNYNMDIIIISRRSFNIHLMKKIDSSIDEGDEDNGFIHIYSYKYSYFTSERPKHKLVAPQRILSKTEEKEILTELSTDKKNLPKIRKDEPISIWLGAEIGDIIEAKCPSEASGIETKYLVVRP